MTVIKIDPYQSSATPPQRGYMLRNRAEWLSWNRLVRPTHPDYSNEVMLIQCCLGVNGDGIIGEETRSAALEAYERRMGLAPDLGWFGWVVERYTLKGEPFGWWALTPDKGNSYWVNDVNMALRFARKVDAERYIRREGISSVRPAAFVPTGPKKREDLPVSEDKMQKVLLRLDKRAGECRSNGNLPMAEEYEEYADVLRSLVPVRGT